MRDPENILTQSQICQTLEGGSGGWREGGSERGSERGREGGSGGWREGGREGGRQRQSMQQNS